MTILYSIGIFYLCPLILCLLFVKLIHKWSGYSLEGLRKAIYYSLTPALNILTLVVLIHVLCIILSIYIVEWVEPKVAWIVGKIGWVVDKIVVIMEEK